MAALVGREEELLAQLRALLFLPSSSPAPAPAIPAAPPVKSESAAGPLAGIIIGSGGGRGPAAASSAMATADASSYGGGGRRRRRLGTKRDRDDSKAKDEQDDEDEPAAAQPHYYSPSPCKRRKEKQQNSKCLVTSVPDFDGYQWRKYGQKQIEGAMYSRSYYRCTRSAEQGCQAKRTVQRNDDAGDSATATPEYTVVYVAEHTCTATDSLEAPVILETTTTVVVPSPSSAAANNTNTHADSIIVVPTTSAGSCSTSTTTAAASTSITTTGTESPAISGDDITCWTHSSGASSDYNNYAADDYYCGELFAAAAHGGWATGQDSASLQEMEDLTGPIRSPVHVPAPGWTIDQLLPQLVNEHVCHF